MPHGQEIYIFFYRFGINGILGIIICNIVMAIIIYKTLKILYENNINVPKDISIIGFNDLIASQHTIPPLTTVRVHIENLASAAVDLIIERITKGRKYCKKVVIPSELIIRKSSDIVKK